MPMFLTPSARSAATPVPCAKSTWCMARAGGADVAIARRVDAEDSG